MDGEHAGLAPEWLEAPAWWGGRAADAALRPPTPPAAPLTPPTPTPEAAAAAARADAFGLAQAVLLLRQENAALKAQLERALVAREDATAQQRALELRTEAAQAAAKAAAADAARAHVVVSRQEAAISRLAVLLTERHASRAAAQAAAPACNGGP